MMKRNLKWTTLAIGMVTSSLAFAGNRFRENDEFRQVLAAKYLHGDMDEARNKASTLRDELPSDDALRTLIAAEGFDDRGNVTPDPAELAYATGKKSEFYCRAKGLVMATGQHADGSVSRLVLISANRAMASDAYALTEDGSQWIYELSNSFRQPVRSEIWQTYGRPGAFDVFEVRRLPDDKSDQASWRSKWGAGRNEGHYSVNTSSRSPEPTRGMVMAFEYQLWGSDDLGGELTFAVGQRDVRHFRVAGRLSGRMPLLSEREVAEHLPALTYEDAGGASHTFSDCYRVDLTIKYDPDQKNEAGKKKAAKP